MKINDILIGLCVSLLLLGQGCNTPTINTSPGLGDWTVKSEFEGAAPKKAVGFSIGSKGYVTTGASGSTRFSDLWDFDPTIN